MKPTPTLLRNALLLLWGAAVFSGAANAQNAFAPPSGADGYCELGAPATIACVRQGLITNDQLSSAVVVNSPSNHLEKLFREFTNTTPEAYAEAKTRLAGILRHAQSQSAEMGVASPVMYVSMMKTQATQTREGKDFILLNKDAFRLAVQSDEAAEDLKVSLSRELAHIRNGDTSPPAIARLRNNPAASREASVRADLEGAGPLGTRNPIGATNAIEHDMRLELHTLVFAKDNTVGDLDPNRLSDRDYKRISDEHMRVYGDPHTFAAWDRIVALRKESRLMAEYEQAHTVRTHADRESESQWLVAQILPDAMRGGR